MHNVRSPARVRDYIVVSPSIENPFRLPLNLSAAVIGSVAKSFAMDAQELTGSSQTRRHCAARFIVYRLLSDYGYSSAKIGRLVGGRDHTTILNGLSRFDAFVIRDPFVAAVYDRHAKAMREAMAERGAIAAELALMETAA
jgi:hypothetical protein